MIIYRKRCQVKKKGQKKKKKAEIRGKSLQNFISECFPGKYGKSQKKWRIIKKWTNSDENGEHEWKIKKMINFRIFSAKKLKKSQKRWEIIKKREIMMKKTKIDGKSRKNISLLFLGKYGKSSKKVTNLKKGQIAIRNQEND
jgi:hypothetical protein